MDRHALILDFSAGYFSQDLCKIHTGQGIYCGRNLAYETSNVAGCTVISADENNLLGLRERSCGLGSNLLTKSCGEGKR